jgi:hypothetical protein
MKTEGDGEWYKSICTVKLSGQQVFFCRFNDIASREKQKTFNSVLTSATASLCSIILQRFPVLIKVFFLCDIEPKNRFQGTNSASCVSWRAGMTTLSLLGS